MKWVIVVVLGLAGVGIIGFGLMGAAPLSERRGEVPAPPKVGLRAFPSGTVAPPAVDAGTPAAVGKSPTTPPPPPPPPVPAPDAGARVVDAGAAPAVDAGHPAPKEVKNPPPPPTVVQRPPPPPPPRPVPPPPPAGEADLNLRASDTADVYLDGKKVGTSPLMGLKVKAGQHRVRFDCYDAAGNTTPGQQQVITLVADENRLIDFTCPSVE